MRKWNIVIRKKEPLPEPDRYEHPHGHEEGTLKHEEDDRVEPDLEP